MLFGLNFQLLEMEKQPFDKEWYHAYLVKIFSISVNQQNFIIWIRNDKA